MLNVRSKSKKMKSMKNSLTMKQNSLFFFLCFVVVFFAQAQEKLTKEEAIAITLEENYDIEIATNDLEVAENNASVLNSGYLPQVYGSAGANYDIQNRLQQRNGQEATELKDAESKAYNASLNLEYTLFDGLGRLYNYKRLQESYNLTGLQVRETIENTVLQLFSVYFEVARLTENVQILEETIETSRNRVTRSEYAFDFGQATGLEVLNARVDVTNDSIALLNARQQLKNTKRDLNVVMGRDMETGFSVDTLVSFIPALTLKTYLDESLQNNVNILQSESNIQLSEFDIKVSKSGYLPTVGLIGSYGWNKNISPPNPIFNAPGSTSRVTGLSAGVNLRWNLFDGGGTINSVRNAKINKESSLLAKEQVKLNIQRDIANAWGNYQNSLEVYEIQEQNVITNQNNFERSEERFKIGQITSIEYRQAQINLINAKTNKNLAKYDAKLAELQLLQLVGQLLNVEF